METTLAPGESSLVAGGGRTGSARIAAPSSRTDDAQESEHSRDGAPAHDRSKGSCIHSLEIPRFRTCLIMEHESGRCGSNNA